MSAPEHHKGIGRIVMEIVSDRIMTNSEYLLKTISRFWSKVDRHGPDECWLWRGTRTVPLKNGMRYGHFGTTENGKTKNWRAHRLAWTLVNGKIPDDMVIMHTCDVPLCVNPNHLKCGTQRENLQDMQDKGRVAKGTEHGFSRFTEEQVREIRESTERPSVLAKRYDVHPTAITAIRTRKNWAWLN